MGSAIHIFVLCFDDKALSLHFALKLHYEDGIMY